MKFSHIMILYSEERRRGEEEKKRKRDISTSTAADRQDSRSRGENKKLHQRQQTRGIERKKTAFVCVCVSVWVGG